jgi:hypothetical protein
MGLDKVKWILLFMFDGIEKMWRDWGLLALIIGFACWFSLWTMINELGDFVTYVFFWIIGYKLRVIDDCSGRPQRWTENVRFPIWDFDIHEWVRVVLLGWL